MAAATAEPTLAAEASRAAAACVHLLRGCRFATLLLVQDMWGQVAGKELRGKLKPGLVWQEISECWGHSCHVLLTWCMWPTCLLPHSCLICAR